VKQTFEFPKIEKETRDVSAVDPKGKLLCRNCSLNLDFETTPPYHPGKKSDKHLKVPLAFRRHKNKTAIKKSILKEI